MISLKGPSQSRYDAIIVGGSFAGLSAALHLARARRHVLVVDAGKPRNRFSDHSHGVIAQDGASGANILARARAQVGAYPSATIENGTVVSTQAAVGGFEIQLADGSKAVGRRLLLATGVTDVLPDITGLAERWGKTALHCPYCHGYELGEGQQIGVIATGPASIDQAWLVADWGSVTLFTNANVELDEAQRSMLRARSVTIERERVAELIGSAPPLAAVRLRGGRVVPVLVLLAPPQRATSPFADQLGCAFDETPIGSIVSTDMWQQTTVPGVYAAGENARMAQNINFAAADGTAAGVGMRRSLIGEYAAA